MKPLIPEIQPDIPIPSPRLIISNMKPGDSILLPDAPIVAKYRQAAIRYHYTVITRKEGNKIRLWVQE